MVLKSIYVGNVPYSATEDDIRALFGKYGNVNAVKIVMDRSTRPPRPKGFCFVEMDDSAASEAISALDNSDFQGRALKVNLARDRE